MRELSTKFSSRSRLALALALLALGFALWPARAPHAQRSSEAGVNVTGVSAQQRGQDAVVSLSADGALSRAQTWQDDEGFHVVLYKGQSAVRGGLPRGVKARRVGDSLEFVVPVRPGGSVYVQPHTNQLDLVVNGGLGAGPTNAERTTTAQAERAARAAERERVRAQTTIAAGAREPGRRTEATNAATTKPALPQSNQKPQANSNARPQPNNGAQSSQQNQPAAPAGTTSTAAPAQPEGAPQTPAPADSAAAANVPPPAPVAPPVVIAAPLATGESVAAESSGSLQFALVVLGLFFTGGLIAFGVIYWRQRGAADRQTEAQAAGTADEQTDALLVRPSNTALAKFEANAAAAAITVAEAGHEPHPQGDRRKGAGRRAEDKQRPEDKQRQAPAPALDKHTRMNGHAPATPLVIFGAYRIDQEVEKLLQGQAHSIEVLAARAPDDRRAVEASLLKALLSDSLGSDERRRACTALDEYGFVARQSAALLLASDVYERTSAARVLGEVKSPAALPFLLEALYDPEPVVCTEVVASLGALGLPSAIGALLDVARRHPELPTTLLGRALSACSVDCIELSADGSGRGYLLAADGFTGDINGLEPVAELEQLPEWLEDESLIAALDRLHSDDAEARCHAVQQLAQFQVQRVVEVLAEVAAGDADSTVRATAITSLGIIGHESVFASVLTAMADEAREVRAAAARALSRLSFDRADAYVRALESGDELLIKRLASACLTAGLAAQALDRLASDDRRQAYEAFSLLSLVAGAGEAEFILRVVEEPGELGRRLAAARLLALLGDPDMGTRLRRVALGDGTPEKLRNAILEALYRDDPAAVGRNPSEH